MVRKEM